MKLSSGEKTGITTAGMTGITILAGVIFAGLSLWWLILSAFFIISAIGHESGSVRK
tara:strand:- start:1758 stop:1925 length:168 start_codon:yes stop_codon:yes gene_type:complete